MSGFRRDRAIGAIWALRFFFGVLAAAQTAHQITLPPARGFDSRKGLIGGKAAVGAWPSTTSDLNGKPADPTGFETHIAPRDSLEAEVVHPAGEWFFPPAGGVFHLWIESPGRFLISPSPTPLLYTFPPPAAEYGLALITSIVPAGRVRLASPTCGGDCTLGLLHANSHIGPDRGLRPEMKRLLPEPMAIEHGALMPAGAVAAMLYDKRLHEYRAVEAPVQLAPGQTAALHLRPPGPGVADLVVVLTRPKVLAKATEENAMPRLLVASGKSFPPAFAVTGPKRLYAIWKGIAAGKGTLQLESKTLRLPQPEIVLRPGHVESVEATLATLPHLGVRLDLPDELRRGPLRVSVARTQPPAGDLIRDVAADAERADFQHVPAAPLQVSVVAGPWELAETVDLSDGQDAEVTLRAQLTTLEGTVYYGRDPRRAKITFRTNHADDEVSVETDPKGRYRIILARPWNYMVMVQFPDRGRPFLVVLNVPGSGRQVVRKDTGMPIPKAGVNISNTGKGPDFITQAFHLETGEDGIAHAMPLRPGEFGVSASALHFESAEIDKEEVSEEDFSREVTLRLKPLDDENPVALLLPSGQPALGAEVWVRPPESQVLSADETGRVSLPGSAAGAPLLVRAPGAASGFVVWDGTADTIRLDPAGPPLTVAARKENGDPAAWARVALWIDGARFSGQLLQWAFNAQPADRNGSVTLQGLPPRPVAVLFWLPDQRTAGLAETGAFDSQRTTVAFPWPAIVNATVME